MNKENPVLSSARLQNVAFKLISICLVIAILVYAESVLLPIALAALIALAIITPVKYLERKGLPRFWASTICLIIALIALSGILIFISTQVMRFEKDFPLLESKFLTLIEDLQHFIHYRLHVSQQVVDENLAPLLNKAMAQAPTIVGSLVGFFSNSLFILGFTLFYTLMILIYRDNIKVFIGASFNYLGGSAKDQISNKTQSVIKNYITGLLLEMLFVATLLSVGFNVVGAKYAFLLAVITAIMNVVPYLGFLTAALLSVVITFATNSSDTAIWVGVISIGIHLIDSNIFLPAVVGNKVSINALATVIGVFVGNLVWGIPGMFLAVPVVALLKVVCDAIPSMHHWGLLLGEIIIDKPEKKKK